jgi:hypothetical protein
MTTLTDLTQYLTMLSTLNNGGPTLAGFVLAHGRDMTVHPDASIAFPRSGKMKECYMNATRYCMAHAGTTYCEGYALGVIPMPHAWCIDSAGYVIDPTWRDGAAYFGVPFKRSYLHATLARRGYYGIIDDFENGFPLVRGEHSPSTFLAQ